MDEVTQLIVVDTRSIRRLGVLSPLVGRPDVDVHVYDHHPPCVDPIPASFSLIEPLGAAATLILEEVLRRGLVPTPQEATLFALGIYEDTGGLIFGGTTDRDYDMMCRMRSFGADLTLIPSAVESGMSSQERRMLDILVENAWERYVAGARLVLTKATVQDYVEGLSLFVHRLRDFFSADVVLAAVRMEGRTYVVARSRQDILDVAALLKPLGGGGHPQAASATVSDRVPSDVLDELERCMEGRIVSAITVADVMTSPVMAVDEDSSVNDAYRTMLRYGHSALPVTRAGGLIGLITRKDLDKAQLHGYGEATVGTFMTEGVISISSQASVEEAHRSMVSYNIGRLPVLYGGELRGILTRTDLLRALYPASVSTEYRSVGGEYPWTENLASLLDDGLSPSDRALIERMGQRAQELGMSVYVVGGCVRDLLLGRSVIDLDLVIEGDVPAFLRSWEREGAQVSVHERFQTGTVRFLSGRKVDVAAARREFYEFPSAQPTVSSDSLKHDLYRRDFTVNAMALAVDRRRWGTLFDYFGGRRDLISRKLRTLHNLSFVEDPTRIFRGVRLEQRLGFELDDNALRSLNNCVHGGLWAGLSGYRLRSEIELSLLELRPWPIVRRMAELGLWEPLFPGIRVNLRVSQALRRLSIALRRLDRDLIPMGDDRWIAALACLFRESPVDLCSRAADRLNLRTRERVILEDCLNGLGPSEESIGGRMERPFSLLVQNLRTHSPVAVLFWAVATDRWRFRRRLFLYLTRLAKVASMLSGGDLLDMGYRESPEMGQILEELLRARLDGEVDTRDDEIQWVVRRFQRT